MTSLLRHGVTRGAGTPPTRPSYSFACKSVSGNISPKVAINRQELADLTGNPFTSMVLNQLLYWTERLPDLDLLIQEEFYAEGVELPQHGWFYKSAQELINETSLCITCVTLRKHISFLIENGWVSERANPKNKWDKTTQYRVNLRQIQIDLHTCGWSFADFPEVFESLHAKELNSIGKNPRNLEKSRELKNLASKAQNLSFDAKQEIENPSFSADSKILASKQRESTFDDEENRCSNVQNLSLIYLTENTTENTNREHTTRARKNQNAFCQNEILEENAGQVENSSIAGALSSPVKAMVTSWEEHIGNTLHLTKTRTQQLNLLLERYFHNDLSKWEAFCLRLKSSSFLMGEGARGWRVSLDWILVEENLLKILEGNFDNLVTQKREKSKQVTDQKAKEILSSIEDPIWRGWCAQWIQGIWLNETLCLIESLSCQDLQRIANARFLEVEDERLVWIGSSDPQVLSRIEDLRLPLSSLVARTFPKVRTIRTRLIEISSKLDSNFTNQTAEGAPLSPHSPTQQIGKNHAE